MNGAEKEHDAANGADGNGRDDPSRFAAAGISGNAYASPSYRYTVVWDANEWRVADARVIGVTDHLRLENGRGSALTFEATSTFAGDVGAHLRAQVAFVNQAPRQFYNVHMVKEALVGNDRAVAIYRLGSISPDHKDVIDDLECRTLVPGESSLGIVLAAAPSVYGHDVVAAAGVLARIKMPRG